MEAFLNKKYKLVHRDEYFDQYLKALGFSWLQTKFAKQVPAIEELTKSDDGFFHLITDVKVFTRVQKFQPGVEIEQASIEGSLVKNTFRIEGDKLIETQIGAKNVTITRHFSATEIQSTLSCDNVKTETFSKIIP